MQKTLLGTTLAAVTLTTGATIAQAEPLTIKEMQATYPDSSGLVGASSNEQNVVTSVSQLSDVQPTDWAFQALQSLVERYGCIAGYPDGTYKGSRALSRYEFAAGLNACMDRVNELIAAGTADLVTKQDLATLQALQDQFKAELEVLRGKVDGLTARVDTLEAQQFSTTTKLQGEVAFTIADVFGTPGDNINTVFNNKIRLQFVTSFTGKDRLFTRLITGNIGNSFSAQLGTQEGRFAHDTPGDSNFILDRLHYVFPVNDKLQATVMASLGGHHFYSDTFNPGLEAGGGATGALTRFGERNPIYRFGLGGQGLGLRYQFNPAIEVSAGYLARGGENPGNSSGLFNGNYSAMGQLVIKPSKDFRFGFTYLNGYDVAAGRRFAFGGTGTNFANFLAVNTTLNPAVTGAAVSSNAYGFQALYNISPQFSIRGWFGYTAARLIGVGDADLFTYGVVLAFPDLGSKGSMGAIVLGAEPYLASLSGTRATTGSSFPTSTPFHIEAFYKYSLNDNISVTPGVIWLASPNQSPTAADVIIGTVRTTFSF